MQETKLGVEQAIAMLPDKPHIHTFERRGFWAGCDMERETILEAIRAQDGARLSDEAACFEHRLVIDYQGHRLFLATLPPRARRRASTTTPQARRLGATE